jgi:hypothetical protein
MPVGDGGGLVGIDTRDRPPLEVLMDALAAVEKCKRVVIILEAEDSFSLKTNCDYRELKWLLDQATHVTMNELFDVPQRGDFDV